VGKAELTFGAQRLARERQIGALSLARPTWPREQGRPVEGGGALGWQNGGDLGERAARGLGEILVGAALDPARPERQRLDLLDAEHQRRQGEPGLKHVAEPRLTLDMRPLSLKRADVAVERATRNVELLRQRR